MRRRTVIGEFGRYCLGLYYGHDLAVAKKLKAEREADLEEWRAAQALRAQRRMEERAQIVDEA